MGWTSRRRLTKEDILSSWQVGRKTHENVCRAGGGTEMKGALARPGAGLNRLGARRPTEPWTSGG